MSLLPRFSNVHIISIIMINTSMLYHGALFTVLPNAIFY